MTLRKLLAVLAVLWLTGMGALMAQSSRKSAGSARPEGPCDVYAAANDPCVAAHSTTRALYRSYNGPLYQVLRQSDGKTLDIAAVTAAADGGGYADAAAQDRFCKDTFCWISKVYDQSPKHNDLTQAPRGGFRGPAMGGMNNLPVADMAPVSVMGHKVYGVFISPGMGLRVDDPRGTAVDDQAEGQYWVINGRHFNAGCCFDYGNAETDSRDDDNGTMETAYFGDNPDWIHGTLPGPWIETDQENNLVGCVPPEGSRHCDHLPDIKWRFVTAIAKGEPHHWTSMGGDSQSGPLQVMFDGRRVNSSYDPMRKQGAILLGNGGDNSNGSQGTFYEGAVTAAGTFPTDATDQQVQASIVAAKYDVQPVSVRLAGAPGAMGVQAFVPGGTRDIAVEFTNVGSAPATGVALSLDVPQRWKAAVQGGNETSKTFPEAIAPGKSVSATFTVTAGPGTYNGDVEARASWKDQRNAARSETMSQKVRGASPVKINEFRVGANGNTTDSFIELYNVGTSPVDVSRWTLTERPSQQASDSATEIPAGTTLQPKTFYLLGLANSALPVGAAAGQTMVPVRSTAGMNVGDSVEVGSGKSVEIRKIATVGTAASEPTTLWQPLPDGPITMAPGSTNVPVESAEGFKIGEKIALGYGLSAPYVGRGNEKYEIATVTAVGKAGTQAYLATDAPVGARTLQVTEVENISVGDTIRLDIDSKGHGIETVKVTRVGTEAAKTNLVGDFAFSVSRVKVRSGKGLKPGDKIQVGTPATREEVTVSAVEELSASANAQRDRESGDAEITFSPALKNVHGRDEWVVSPGTGVEIAAPLRFNHAANLPFADRGTGITFKPATRFPHTSDEPVQALGSGVTLDQRLAKEHEVDAALRDERVTTSGYQGTPKPDQWFGGPELVTHSLLFGRMITVREASMVLRDASGLVVDSLNYGGVVDAWTAKGDQAESGVQSRGCFVPSPEPVFRPGRQPANAEVNRSSGRYPDGMDTNSDCTDFRIQSSPTPGAANRPDEVSKNEKDAME